MKRWYLLVLIIVVAAVFAYIKVTAAPQLSDEAQIKAMLQKGETAIENKDSKFTTSCISPNYSDRYGFKSDTMRMELVQVALDGGTYDVQTSPPVILVNGNKATASMNFSVNLSSDAYHRSYNHPITLDLAKETTKHLLVLHKQVWRVTSVDNLPEDF